jgi:hypothetical protein
MQTVWRYSLPKGDVVSVGMPVDAEVLSVHARHGKLCVWALVDPHAPPVARSFRRVSTSRNIDGGVGRFLGTVLMENDTIEWHVWEQ